MNFLKENSYYITRLIITHIGMAVFGVVMFLSTAGRTGWLPLAAGIFSALFYIVLVYVTMWEAGASDKPAIDAGRKPYNVGKGALIGLLAQAIFLFLVLLLFVSSLLRSNDIFAVVYAVCHLILLLIDGCFAGIMTYVSNFIGNTSAQILVYTLGSVAVIFSSTLGYCMGVKEIRILPVKKNEKE